MLQAGDRLPTGAPEGAGDGGQAERLAEFDRALAEVAARVEPAYRKAEGWLEQTRAGLMELLRFCDERPEAARELVVDSIAWGPELLRRRGQLLDTLAAALDRGRAQAALLDAGAAPSSADPAPGATLASVAARYGAEPPETAENLVGACVSLVHTRLLQAGGGPCLELGPSLMSMIAHPYLGPQVARRELERSLVNAGGPSERDSEVSVAGVRERSY